MSEPLTVVLLASEYSRRLADPDSEAVELVREYRARFNVNHGLADFTPFQTRKEAEAAKVLSILDEIAVEEMRAQAYEEAGSGKDGER